MARLLHLTTGKTSLDQHLGSQLQAFAEIGYEVSTASAPGVHLSAVPNKSNGLHVRHHAMPVLDNGLTAGTNLRAVSQLRLLLNELKPDIVHTHSSKPTALGVLIGKLSRVPIVVNTVHDSRTSTVDGLGRRVAASGMERLASTCSDAEFVQNAADYQTLRSHGAPESRLHLLGYGIDVEAFSPSPARARAARCLRIRLGIPFRTPVVGIHGPPNSPFGYRGFFEAIIQLRKRFTTKDLAFVVSDRGASSGDGRVDQQTIERMRNEFGVHFLATETAAGDADGLDQASVLAALDLVALPTDHGAPQTAAMEASTMGLPVITTGSPAETDIVDHRKTGLVVRAGRPQQLALAIERLVNLPALRLALGRSGRSKALDDFDERDVLDKTLTVYRDLLVSKGIPVPDQPRHEGRPWYADSIDLVDRTEADAVSRS